MLAMLLGPAKRTVTNLICARGGQHADWSADYRLYSKHRVDESVLFSRVREALADNLKEGEPLVAALDDTIVRKIGKKIHGSGWKRDPTGPAFQTNLVHSQRYLQISAAWPLENGEARMVPIDLLHAPTPVKPKAKASADDHKAYREELKQQNLNLQTLKRMEVLRRKTPAARHLIFTGDGSFTNQTVLRDKPKDSTYIGRTRKDMALHYPPEQSVAGANGRPPRYGAKAPTPEELRQDENVPWQYVGAFAAGKVHQFRIKTIGPVLWRKAGADLPLRVVVIAPLGYRIRKGSKMLYRQPAYLICTDPDLPLEKLLQYYLWRWGIEVNFREEKSIIGTGDAQVRTEASNQHLPAVSVGTYAILWTVALQALAEGENFKGLASPKWREARADEEKLPSTGDLLRLLRYETWAGALRPATFYPFVSKAPPGTKAEKPLTNLPSALFNVA